MRLQDLPVDPADATDRVREVMARDEFRYEKSLIDRIGAWIGEQLQKLFGEVDPGAPPAGFGGGAGSLVAWLLILLAVAAVIATVVYVVRRRVRAPEVDEEPALNSEIEQRSPAGHWAREAERFEAAGEWKEALRARYRELVRTLVDRRQLPDIAGLTTGELRVELHRSTPTADAQFDRLTELFELAWYADRPTGPAEHAELRELSAAVLERDPEQRFDAGGQLDGEGVAA